MSQDVVQSSWRMNPRWVNLRFDAFSRLYRLSVLLEEERQGRDVTEEVWLQICDMLDIVTDEYRLIEGWR